MKVEVFGPGCAKCRESVTYAALVVVLSTLAGVGFGAIAA